VVQPFISGVYAGDAEQLSTRHAFPKLWTMAENHGSIIRAQIAAAKHRRQRGEKAVPKIISFRRGLQTLPHALASRMKGGVFSLNAHIERLVRNGNWQVHWREGTSGATRVENFDTIVSALPASGLSRLAIGNAGEQPLATLAQIYHPPISSLFLGFKREQVAHPLDGFGALVPSKEKCAVLGTIFSSSLFPERAPAGHVAITVFIGGALQPALASLPDTELLALARRDLDGLLGLKGEPAFVRRNFWPGAIPQYALGYEQHLATIAACEERHPGFFAGGQVRHGISLPNCIAAGEQLAARSVR
jgi:oxygen-dependent protoporphyrinogen oxidase